MMQHVALYCRLSPRPDGSYEGVEDQETWGREYADDHWPGLPVVVYADTGISAANGDHRPRYEALRSALGRGEVAHLWTVEQSRIERTEVGWFAVAAEMDDAGVSELHTGRDGVIRVRDEVAGIRAVLAAGEVRKLRRRVRDTLAERAAQGRPSGASPFGYRHSTDPDNEKVKTLEIIAEEAAIVRESADRFLSGWGLTRIAEDLRGRGFTGKYGGLITGGSVRKMISNAAVAGMRSYHGRTIPGTWPAILERDVWDAVHDRLKAPRTVHRSDGKDLPVPLTERGWSRRYLLTGGIAFCGVCGAQLGATMKQVRKRYMPYYLCLKKYGGRSCVGIMGERTEDEVAARLLDELDRPAFRTAFGVDEHLERREGLTDQLRALDVRRNDLAAMWAADEISADEWRAARAGLDQREHSLRADLAAIPPPVASVDFSMIREGWKAMILDERREIIGMFVERVVIHRAKIGTRGFDPGRVAIEWRQR